MIIARRAAAAVWMLAAALGGGCARGEGVTAEVAPPAAHVDSIFPIEEELRRFRATLDEHPERLAQAAPDRDELIRRFVAALEAGDLPALQSLALTRAEFAYLYYPYTRYTRRPYELGPAIVWFEMQNYSGRGLSRALQRHGGRPLGFAGYRCPEDPLVEGENRIWTGCVVERVTAGGRTQALPLLGPILERRGEFKFLSHANRL